MPIDIYTSGLFARMIFDWKLALSVEDHEFWVIVDEYEILNANGAYRWLLK